MLEPVTDIDPAGLTEAVREEFSRRSRLVAITASMVEEGVELLYHFDRDLVMHHLRVQVASGATLESVTPVYGCAMVYENEIVDQFGLRFRGLVPDFEGGFFLEREAVKAPLTSAVKIPAAKGGKQA